MGTPPHPLSGHLCLSDEGAAAGAFTLLEAIVVIVVIGVLAMIATFAMTSQVTKTKTTATNEHFRQVRTLIDAARTQTSHNLMTITGSGCSDCVCRTVTLAPNMSDPGFAATS